MGMKVEGQVGPRTVADGANTELRQGRTGALVVSDGHGRYREPTSRGLVFIASTAVAGVAPGTTLSTAPPMALWNPPGSGVNLSVARTSLGFVSGTLGAGTIAYAVVSAQTTVPTGGTELTPASTNLSSIRSRGRAFQGSTFASSPTILAPAFVIGTTPTTPVLAPATDDLGGLFEVTPGTALVLQGVAAAGTTPLVLFGIVWEEIQIPAS